MKVRKIPLLFSSKALPGVINYKIENNDCKETNDKQANFQESF